MPGLSVLFQFAALRREVAVADYTILMKRIA